MARKIIFLLLAMAIILPANIYAAENSAALNIFAGNQTTPQKQGGFLLPKELEKLQAAVQVVIDNKNISELQSLGDAKYVKYNKDGSIISILYSNGKLFLYSYKYGSDGKLSEVSISNGSVSLTFTKDDRGGILLTIKVGNNSHDGSKGDDTVYFGDNQRQNGPQSGVGVDAITPSSNLPAGSGAIPPVGDIGGPQIAYYFPVNVNRVSLEDIATKPIKFDSYEITKAVNKVVQQKDEAEAIYVKNTASYYDQIGNKILDDSGNLKMNSLETMKMIDKIRSHDTPVSEKRDAIDEIVAKVYTGAREGSTDKIIVDFINLEKELRMGILVPQKGIYDKKIESAVKYINGTIDRLLDSNLAVYLNSKKDKVDVIINLPKVKNTQKASQK